MSDDIGRAEVMLSKINTHQNLSIFYPSKDKSYFHNNLSPGKAKMRIILKEKYSYKIKHVVFDMK